MIGSVVLVCLFSFCDAQYLESVKQRSFWTAPIYFSFRWVRGGQMDFKYCIIACPLSLSFIVEWPEASVLHTLLGSKHGSLTSRLMFFPLACKIYFWRPLQLAFLFLEILQLQITYWMVRWDSSGHRSANLYKGVNRWYHLVLHMWTYFLSKSRLPRLKCWKNRGVPLCILDIPCQALDKSVQEKDTYPVTLCRPSLCTHRQCLKIFFLLFSIIF